MTCADHQRMVADAILLERAMGALERQMPRELVTDPTAHAVYHFLKGAAFQLRKDAGQELPPFAAPWADTGYTDAMKDIAANFAREPERRVIE